MMTISDLCKAANGNAVAHGFYNDETAAYHVIMNKGEVANAQSVLHAFELLHGAGHLTLILHESQVCGPQ